jgi:pimeloyl-ACP methyl ester carboxylesterase
VTDAELRHFTGHGGMRLAYREVGEGRPVVLMHGFFTTGAVAWLRSGHAARLVERGHRVIVPDMRGHGDSPKPHDPAAYPPDVLTDDALALVAHLGLTDYDLGGYSLGARTIVRMLVRGASPRRAAVGGAGFDQLLHAAGRGTSFRHVLDHLGRHEWGSRDWLMEGFLRKVKGDPVALRLVLETPVDTSSEQLAAVAVPTLVISGTHDEPEAGRTLASTLRHGTFVEVPGDHVSASSTPELGQAMADWFA